MDLSVLPLHELLNPWLSVEVGRWLNSGERLIKGALLLLLLVWGGPDSKAFRLPLCDLVYSELTHWGDLPCCFFLKSSWLADIFICGEHWGEYFLAWTFVATLELVQVVVNIMAPEWWIILPRLKFFFAHGPVGRLDYTWLEGVLLKFVVCGSLFLAWLKLLRFLRSLLADWAYYFQHTSWVVPDLKVGRGETLRTLAGGFQLLLVDKVDNSFGLGWKLLKDKGLFDFPFLNQNGHEGGPLCTGIDGLSSSLIGCWCFWVKLDMYWAWFISELQNRWSIGLVQLPDIIMLASSVRRQVEVLD